MEIAIVGAKDSVEKVYNTLSIRYKNIKFEKYAETEIKTLIKKAKEMDIQSDGIFFTGVGVYSEISKEVDFNQPVVYSVRGAVSIIKAFTKLSKDYKDFKKINIGMDIVKEKDFLDILEEFNIGFNSYYIQYYDNKNNEEYFLQKYIDDFQNGKIDCVLTAFGHIYGSLKELGYPVYRIEVTNIDIKETFKKLYNKISLKNIDDKTALVQIIEIIESTEDDEISLELTKDIMMYCKEIEGVMNIEDKSRFIILSNKGSTSSLDNIEFLSEIIKKYEENGFKLGVGIGEGLTIYKSELNARNALRRSLTNNKGGVFYYDGETVYGPLFKDNNLKYNNISNEKTIKLSEKIGISTQYLEKIDAVINKLGRDEFTSKELSEILMISERSANRILKKLIDSGYGVESGTENSLGAGRPRRRIKIVI